MSAEKSEGTQNSHTEDSAVVYAAICDLNGIWRGKRLPSDKIGAVSDGGLKMPLSLSAVDIWGDDVLSNPLFTEDGDGDCVVSSTGRAPLVVEGAKGAQSSLYPLWYVEDDHPHPADPRAALAQVQSDFLTAGMTPVVGAELEFYLIDPKEAQPQSGVSAPSGRRLTTTNVMTVADLQAVQPFLDDVAALSAQNDIKLESSIAEAGPGQYEVVLGHCADAVAAADNFALLKYLIRITAQKHGMEACFMAKPYADAAGNGFHAHLSLLDQSGENLFADGDGVENPLLRKAVAGMLVGMPQSMLIFAPHLNSYKRYVAEALAPSCTTWGEENRTAAVRIPLATGKAKRIEHRVAGADANPYLVLTAILRAALIGIETDMEPPATIDEQEGFAAGAPLPTTWETALKKFEASSALGLLFTAVLQRSIADAKRQEQNVFARHLSQFELDTYRDVI